MGTDKPTNSPDERARAVEGMGDEEAHHFLMDENERRVRALFKASAGTVDLENAFDFQKIATYVTHIALDLGILDRADLDFQGRKATMLDEIERQYDEAMRDREAEVARHKLERAGFRMGTGGEDQLGTLTELRPFEPDERY
jgi:hypothetical protein